MSVWHFANKPSFSGLGTLRFCVNLFVRVKVGTEYGNAFVVAHLRHGLSDKLNTQRRTL